MARLRGFARLAIDYTGVFKEHGVSDGDVDVDSSRSKGFWVKSWLAILIGWNPQGCRGALSLLGRPECFTCFTLKSSNLLRMLYY
jgi:hypothetical protein